MHILILNGPNLGHLGKRQPEIYGSQGMDIVPALVKSMLPQEEIILDFFQSNQEGVLIDRLEQARADNVDGIVFNAGAFTHTSLALADSLAWIKIPCVEVHISNVMERAAASPYDSIRAKSFIAPHCIGVISGFGLAGYALAVQALVQHINTQF